jgi:hypothetical protein
MNAAGVEYTETEVFALAAFGSLSPMALHVIFSVYLDESGTQQEALILGACATREYLWVEWEKQIKKMQEKLETERLHSAHLFRDIQKTHPGVSDDEIRMMERGAIVFTSVQLLRYCEFGITAVARKSDYEKYYLMKRGLPLGIKPESRYRICLKYALDSICQRIFGRYAQDLDRIAFFIEGSDEFAAEAQQTYFEFRRRLNQPVQDILSPTLGVIDNSSKRDRRLFAPDFFAHRNLKLERDGRSAKVGNLKIPLDGIILSERRTALTGGFFTRTRKATIAHRKKGLEYF